MLRFILLLVGFRLLQEIRFDFGFIKMVLTLCVGREDEILWNEFFRACCWRWVPWRIWHEGRMEGGALQLYCDLLLITLWFSMIVNLVCDFFCCKCFVSFCCWWHLDSCRRLVSTLAVSRWSWPYAPVVKMKSCELNSFHHIRYKHDIGCLIHGILVLSISWHFHGKINTKMTWDA